MSIIWPLLLIVSNFVIPLWVTDSPPEMPDIFFSFANYLIEVGSKSLLLGLYRIILPEYIIPVVVFELVV